MTAFTQPGRSAAGTTGNQALLLRASPDGSAIAPTGRGVGARPGDGPPRHADLPTDRAPRLVPVTPHLAFACPAHPGSVAAARRRVRAHLRERGCGPETLAAAVLLTSELVTNAVCHTTSATVGCVVRTGGGQVRIEVGGEGGAQGIVPGPAGAMDVHGRGLLIVDTLATAWGVHSDGQEHTVWCVLSDAVR